MSKSKFGPMAKARLKVTDEQAHSTTGAQAERLPTAQATITQDDLDAITPPQTEPYTTVGCKITKDAAHFFSIRAKQTKLPVADVIRRALLETYGKPDGNSSGD